MNRSGSVGIVGVDKHVYARCMSKGESVRFQRRANRIQVLAVNRDIDILGQPGSHRIPGIDVHENRQPPDNSVGNCRCIQGCSKPLGNIEDLFHSVFEDGVGQHGFLSLF